MGLGKKIGKLEPVPIREVWPDEAQDLTPWLADNPEALGRALGMDLELVGSEVAVGSFKADLFLRDANTGKSVVVENMIGKTDHDHLGKIITYAAGLDVSHAALIVETFRSEHISALHWLNTNSRDAVNFFGIELRVWSIDGSRPAPQLDVVVEPDEWVRRVNVAKSGDLTDKQLAYRDFWGEFLPAFRKRYPGWSNAKKPSTDNWRNFKAQKKHFHYSVNFCRQNGQPSFRFEIYVDGENPGEASERFSKLKESRADIEQKFNLPLTWEQLDQSRGCRVACYYPEKAEVNAREQWEALRDWSLEHIGPFKDAMQPHIDRLD